MGGWKSQMFIRIAGTSQNPNSLYSLFFPSQSFSFSSSTKTIIPISNLKYSFSASRLNLNPNPTSNPLCSITFSFQSISIPSLTFSYSQTLTFCKNSHSRITCCFISNFASHHSLFRSFSISSGVSDLQESSRVATDRSRHKTNHRKSNVNPQRITDIVELIKEGHSDMESKLNWLDPILSISSISEIIQVLNLDGVSAWRFLDWVRETQPGFSRNADFCSLIINNVGMIEDYDSMLLLLKNFSGKGICLTEKAFAFLSASSDSVISVRNSIKLVIKMLNEAGGSCRNSGIYVLIKMLCTLNSFDLAIFVMEETVRKTSYYNVLIWAKCRSSNFQEARDLFVEMKKFGCDPNANSYNYLLSSLLKNGRTSEACNLLEVMEEWGYLPDAITFEVFVYHASRLGRLDFATDFLNLMISRGLVPRLTTHAAFIKGYFYSEQVHKAYKYVADMSANHKCSSNMNYSLLASLHQRRGRVVEAHEILVEMIKKHLKPNFPIYMRVLKDLHKLGMRDLVVDLKNRFSKFHSSTELG